MMELIIDATLVLLVGAVGGFIAGHSLTKRPSVEVMRQRVLDAEVKKKLKEMADQRFREEVISKVLYQQMGGAQQEQRAPMYPHAQGQAAVPSAYAYNPPLSQPAQGKTP